MAEAVEELPAEGETTSEEVLAEAGAVAVLEEEPATAEEAVDGNGTAEEETRPDEA